MPIGGGISKARGPVKVWSDLNLIESQAIDQLVNTANLPCVYKHIAVMPDVHVGIGATVGSGIPTKDAIIPARGITGSPWRNGTSTWPRDCCVKASSTCRIRIWRT